MTDVIFFIKNGWEIIWKQKLIWLFSAISLFNQIFLSIQGKQDSSFLGIFLSLAVVFIYVTLFLISSIGIPFIAYKFAIGEQVTVQETLFATRKFSWRIFGCAWLIFILTSPLTILVLVISGGRLFQSSDITALFLLLTSFFNAFWYFSVFGFFANDWGIWQSVKKGWALFANHFSTLAIIGITLALIFRVYHTVSGILLVLLNSGFDPTALNTINYLNPAILLNKNMLFMLLNGIGGVIFTPFTISVFVLAFLKYSKAKIPSHFKAKVAKIPPTNQAADG